MTEFDHDTAVERLTENSFRGFVDPGWNIGDNPNGGYLLSLATSAIAAVVPHPDPLSITTHFLRPGIADTHCEIEVDLVRTGRTMSTVKATMRQAGKIRCLDGFVSMMTRHLIPDHCCCSAIAFHLLLLVVLVRLGGYRPSN